MFNDATARGAITAVQGELAELSAAMAAANRQLATLAGQLAVLTGDLVRLAERDGERGAALEELSCRIDGIGTATGRQSAALEEHGRRLSDLAGAAVNQEETMKRVGVEIERLGRQAAIDAREMRGNYAGLATIIGQERRTTAGSPDPSLNGDVGGNP